MAGLVAASRFLLAILLGGTLLAASHASADLPETIERIKPSVVVVGTYQQTRSPQFVMRGTGFVVGDGRQVATNAHVIQQALDEAAGERLAIVTRSTPSGAQQRPARVCWWGVRDSNSGPTD
jgi:serine protease Do